MDGKSISLSQFVSKTLATTTFTFNLNDSEGVTFEDGSTGSKKFTISSMETQLMFKINLASGFVLRHDFE